VRLLEERETDELVPRFHHEIKKKRSRDFSDSQKSNFGVSSFSHTASSLQKRRILKDFFLSLSLVVVVRIGFAPPARHHCCVRAMMMMKSFSREKKRKRDQKEDTCEIYILKKKERGTPRSTSPCSPRSKRRTDPDTRPLPPLFFCFAPP
jgi:hypothetical protein